MATMRETDTASWLHNKLASDDMWSGTNIWSSLTKEVLRNTQECFHTLDSQVKIKLLMSFLYIPRRNSEELTSDLNEILEIGCNDTDEWVRILSEILRTFPETGNLNVDLENVSPVFSEIVEDLRQTINNTKDMPSLLPLECPYLNKGALIASMGVQPAPPKHFTLRRKPKSAALRAELFQKATDSSSAQKRSHSSLVGASSASGGMLRRSDSTGKSPLKQPPSSRLSTHSKSTPGASTSVLRGLSAASLKQQNRTAKLLDINEQPIGGGVREAKRRKKFLAEMDQAEEDKKKKESGKTPEPPTPEYAIGLTTPNEVSQATPTTPISATITPSYASMAGLSAVPHLPPATKPQATPMDSPLTASSANFSQELQMHIEREREMMKRRITAAASTSAQQQQQQQQQQQHTTGNPSTTFKPVSVQPAAAMATTPSAPGMVTGRNLMTAPPTLGLGTNRNVAPTPNTNPPSVANLPKRDLKLTREQMLAAQEMFRGANKVTKPEKALILGFMAGARENPFPSQGAVITVKLSEHTETMKESSQTQLVEMLFEMNYDTGHWRRLKRTRVLARQQSVDQVNQ